MTRVKNTKIQLVADFAYIIEPLIPTVLLHDFQSSLKEFEKTRKLKGLLDIVATKINKRPI